MMRPQGLVAPKGSMKHINISYTDSYLPIFGTRVAKDGGRHISGLFAFRSMEVFTTLYIFDSKARNEDSMRV